MNAFPAGEPEFIPEEFEVRAPNPDAPPPPAPPPAVANPAKPCPENALPPAGAAAGCPNAASAGLVFAVPNPPKPPRPPPVAPAVLIPPPNAGALFQRQMGCSLTPQRCHCLQRPQTDYLRPRRLGGAGLRNRRRHISSRGYASLLWSAAYFFRTLSIFSFPAFEGSYFW